MASLDGNISLCSDDGDAAISDNEIEKFDISIQVVTTWLKKRGWQVLWYSSGDHIDAATLPDQMITITRRQVPRHQYYSLLHEASHVDLLTGPLGSRRGEPYGYLDLWYKKVDTRTLRHRIAIVIDEIDTWIHGVNLAKKLGLSLDQTRYRDFRNRNLKTYLEWALDRDDTE